MRYLSKEIEKLSNLQEFIVFENRLTGTIPPSIGNISTLENFVVKDNNLDGNIPPEIGKLSSLKGLSLKSNNFSGKVPSTIFNISTLQKFDLGSNNLFGNLQPGLRHRISPSLEELILSQNQFTGTIPSCISNASQLIKLDLGTNMFSGHVPSEIENLQQLEYFNIQYNQITNEPSANELSLLTSLSKCKNLKMVGLSGNPFNTVLPNLLGIGNNKSLSLEWLDASGCHLKGRIPSGISNFINLIALGLNDNKLSGSFPETLGRRLLRLQDSNFFTSSIPLGFWNNKDILEMGLSSNLLSGALSSEIGSMHSMVYLNLSDFMDLFPSHLIVS
ncbi:PREDICTED: receptor-like protein kinase 2 [Ipomoea nil]|uniref:receptor-like protein kinase 2 n=1 Tax=Ipomoea nil TaxID=35883 RepID=UPI000900D111|nr:PREDICTED: receptor-like protein kinase 2 [Ipomoea nil]